MGEIIINDGYEEYTIKNKQGKELGKILFNPSDAGVIDRFRTVADTIRGYASKLSDNEDIEAVKSDFDKMISEQIDYLFNADVSSTFFSITAPLTLLDSGEFFFENVLTALEKLVEQETGAKIKKMQAKVDKYTRKYK